MKSLGIATLITAMFVSMSFAQIAAPAKQVLISGTVMDDPFPSKRLSSPLKGVTIKLWAQPIYILNSQPEAILPPARSLVDSAISDAQGKFSFSPAQPGYYEVSFDSPGYVSRTITLYAVRDTAISIALLAAGAKAKVAGNVTTPCPVYMDCIRQPVAGCTVTVVKENVSVSPLAQTQAVLYPIKTPTFTAITDAAGQFSIDSVPLSVNGERVVITFRKSGFTSQSIDTALWNTMTLNVNPSLLKPTVDTKDTVYVSPLNPTTRDSLHFSLFSIQHCCGTIYRGNNVTAADTMIMLSYSYDDSMCAFAKCFAAGSSTQFATKPIKAGKYGIYKVESIYCPPGRICPLGLLAPVRVGEITVKTPTGIRPIADNSVMTPESRLSIIGKTASIVLDKNARVSFRAYNLQGALVAVIFNGRASAGTTCFDLNTVFSKTASGTILLSLSVDGGTDTRVLMR